MQDTPVTDTASEPGFDLDAAEIRVLGVLIEKSFITPDAYPMSVNGIVTGCNQLTAREPVMSLSESEVQAAIDSLIGRRLVAKRDQPSARVAKYEHLVRLRHSLPPAEQAVLAMLMLRSSCQSRNTVSPMRCDTLWPPCSNSAKPVPPANPVATPTRAMSEGLPGWSALVSAWLS